MSKLTRNGIAHDLTISPYFYTVCYENTTLKYVFSSEYNKTRFMEKIDKNRDYINKSLTKRFNINIELNLLCDLKLYVSEEKRGFLIIEGKQEYKCLSSLELTGANVTQTN